MVSGSTNFGWRRPCLFADGGVDTSPDTGEWKFPTNTRSLIHPCHFFQQLTMKGKEKIRS